MHHNFGLCIRVAIVMQCNLSVHNANNDDNMPTWSAHAENPNDVRSGMHESCIHANQMFLNNIHVPHFT